MDARIFAFLNRRPTKTFVVYNGVTRTAGVPAGCAREPGRLIFTGNMSFPPNYEAAVWFIDCVLPLLRRARSDIKFVVAGQYAVKELTRRACSDVEILGYCPDLQREIARSRLFVAPLISGSGFKNKILEALDSGTYVAATRIGAEFLPEDLRKKLLVADSAEQLADHILAYLDRPSRFDEPLAQAREIIHDKFQWSKSAQRIAEICSDVSSAG